jgi:biopolymer transport protein ExbD
VSTNLEPFDAAVVQDHMAHLMIPGRALGRKPLDAVLNLVPFIDLLSCCISFLLITAVWTQLASLRAVHRGPGGSDSSTRDWRLLVLIDDQGFRVAEGGEITSIPMAHGKYPMEQLAQKLSAIKQQHQDVNDVTIASEDGVRYDWIVHTMDTAITSGFVDVNLAGAQPL